MKQNQKTITIEFKGNKGFSDEFLKQTLSNALRDAMNKNGMGEALIKDMFELEVA